MSKNNISELDNIAANNADLAGISILGTGLLSTADDSFRTAASFLAKWWEDLGGVNTVGGTGDAISVTTATIYTALKTGMRLQFIASAANTTAATLNLDAIGAKALRKISGGTDVALVSGDIPGAKFRVEVGYDAAANSAAGAWIVLGAAPVSSATTSAQGIVELATVAEALAGTDAVRAVTPAGLYYPTGHLNGLTMSNGTDATNDIDIAVGTARDSTDAANMVLSSILTKQLDAAWAVGTNAGGLDTGSIANTTYHVWLIKRPDTGVVDALFSTSASAPTMPTNYTLKRRIGSIVRSGATILAFKQNGDEFLWNASVTDVSGSTASLTAASVTLTVPLGVKVNALLTAFINSSGTLQSLWLSALDVSDQATGVGGRTVTAVGGGVASGFANVRTNTSGQIRRVETANGGATITIYTYGWIDMRGRAL